MRIVPGLQYLHLQGGRVVRQVQSGYADVLRAVPVDSRTTFNTYSVTKTLTAWAVQLLADWRLVDLHRTAGAYLPALFGRNAPSVEQLLTHRGGLPNPNPLAWCHADALHAKFDGSAFAQMVLQRFLSRRGVPGVRFRYSNLGYLALGLIIERVAARPYADFMHDEIFSRMALEQPAALGFSIGQLESHARGTCRRWGVVDALMGFWMDRAQFVDGAAGRWRQLRPLHVNGSAYGGLIASVQGLAQLLVARMEWGISRNAPYLGWFTGQLAGQSYVCHAGGAIGYYCEVRIYPWLGRASVLATNDTGLRDRRWLDELDRGALAEAF